jgi:hypothetical protein
MELDVTLEGNMSKNLYSSCWAQIYDVIGDWNPQLMRELKSRMSLHNIILTVFVSLTSQSMVLVWCYWQNELHVPWLLVSLTISTWMFISMCVAGVYLLASSFRQEDRQGTLDTLRFTPPKARSIFIGKILGVPALVYLAVASALPLQFYAVQTAHLSRLNVLTWDLAMFGLALMFYLSAVLATLWFQPAPILLAGIALVLTNLNIPASIRWYGEYNGITLQWYGIQLGNHPFSFLLLTAMAGLAIYWLFKALERRYHQPNATILSRGQSYLWSLSYHLFLLGFGTSYAYDINTNKFAERLSFEFLLHTYVGNDTDLGILPIVCWNLLLVWLILLIPLNLPRTKALTEWARRDRTKPDWWKTRIWDDRSPATLAVVVNVVIAGAVWIIPVLLATQISPSSLID